jgi:hypothetical protein
VTWVQRAFLWVKLVKKRSRKITKKGMEIPAGAPNLFMGFIGSKSFSKKN